MRVFGPARRGRSPPGGGPSTFLFRPYILTGTSPDTAMPATKRVPAKPAKVTVPRKPRESDEAKLALWAEQFDAKVDALTTRQDAFLQYLELRQPRQS